MSKRKPPAVRGGQLVTLDYMSGKHRCVLRFWRKRKRKKRINHRMRKALIRAKER